MQPRTKTDPLLRPLVRRCRAIADGITAMDSDRQTAMLTALQQFSETLECSAEETIRLIQDYQVRSALLEAYLNNVLPLLSARYQQGDKAAKAEIDRLSAPVLIPSSGILAPKHHAHRASQANDPFGIGTHRPQAATAPLRRPTSKGLLRLAQSAYSACVAQLKAAYPQKFHQTTQPLAPLK